MTTSIASFELTRTAAPSIAAWPPRPGFNLLVGRSGSGKSTVLGAIDALMRVATDRQVEIDAPRDVMLERGDSWNVRFAGLTPVKSEVLRWISENPDASSQVRLPFGTTSGGDR